MGKIILEDIEIYAYHGHYKEEQHIGGKYLVNLEIETEFEKACKSDRLEDTFNYQVAYNLVIEEMQKNSALLENVADRIIKKMFLASLLVKSVKIKISKMNPPLGGTVKSVCVEISQNREE
jgi:7,8-dihydroneopterin aldolase/epimerase/oxygenase